MLCQPRGGYAYGSLSFGDLCHLFAYLIWQKYKMRCMDKNCSIINSNKQLFLCGWPEYEVITFTQVAQVNTAGSTSSSEIADSTV